MAVEDYSISKAYEGTGFRFWHGLSWCEVAVDGSMMRECKASAMMPAFPEELKGEVAAIAGTLHYPAYEDAYIRFNDLPESGRSRNWASGEVEKGVSVYDARFDVVTGRYSTYGALAGAEIAYALQDAPVYLVTGEEVGRGADGEPLLTNVKVLGTLERHGAEYELA